jgi:hypothetical protein
MFSELVKDILCYLILSLTPRSQQSSDTSKNFSARERIRCFADVVVCTVLNRSQPVRRRRMLQTSFFLVDLTGIEPTTS